MSDPNEQYAYFAIGGDDLDPRKVTQQVGIEPTECWRRGDINPRNRFERKSGRWKLESRLPRTEPLEAHIADVLNQMDSSQLAFQQVSRSYGGVMQLVGYFHSSYPGLSFHEQVIQRLAAYSLAVDFDFYWLYSDPREDT